MIYIVGYCAKGKDILFVRVYRSSYLTATRVRRQIVAVVLLLLGLETTHPYIGSNKAINQSIDQIIFALTRNCNDNNRVLLLKIPAINKYNNGIDIYKAVQ